MSGVGYGFLQMPCQPQSGIQPWWAQIPRHFKWMGGYCYIFLRGYLDREYTLAKQVKPQSADAGVQPQKRQATRSSRRKTNANRPLM
jgi:hypothetical protein